MKILVIAIAMMSATTSFAFENESQDDVTFISWCDQNNVMVLNSATQQVQVLVNCSEQQKTCKAVKRFSNMGSVVTASCK